MIQYHLLLARKHGASESYPVVTAFGSDTRSAVSKYMELSNHPGLADFQKEHAELMFVSDGVVLHHHTFDDPATVERNRKAKVLAEARRISAAHQQAATAAAAAAKQASETRAALKQLTSEQIALLKADDEARVSAENARKAAEESERRAREEAKAARLKAEAEAKAKADAEAARATLLTQWAAQTDTQLLELAKANNATIPEEATRDQIVAALLAAAGFAAQGA